MVLRMIKVNSSTSGQGGKSLHTVPHPYPKMFILFFILSKPHAHSSCKRHKLPSPTHLRKKMSTQMRPSGWRRFLCSTCRSCCTGWRRCWGCCGCCWTTSFTPSLQPSRRTSRTSCAPSPLRPSSSVAKM